MATKKSPKKYFSEYEKTLLMNLYTQKISILENKATNGSSNAEKVKAYEEITANFNEDVEVVTKRDVAQIRQFFNNIKKKLNTKAGLLRQEMRKTGGGEIPQDIELTPLETLFLGDKVVTLPLTTAFDSDTTPSELLECQNILSQKSREPADEPEVENLNPTEQPGQSLEEEMEAEIIPPPEPNRSSKPALKLKDTLVMFRKRVKRESAPSAAGRAASAIEREHEDAAKFARNEERRKESEHQQRSDLLGEQIKLTQTNIKIKEVILQKLQSGSCTIDENLLNIIINE